MSTQSFYQTQKTTSLKYFKKVCLMNLVKWYLICFLQITAFDCNVLNTDAIIVTIAMKLCQGISMSDWPCERFFQTLIWKEMRCNLSLVARYSLKFTHCSLLVVKSLVNRCKMCSFLVTEVTRCKKPLITR